LLANFEFSENQCVFATKEILNLADVDKENSNDTPLNSRSLGHIVSDIWKDRVRLVKRGSAGQRQTFFLNLKRKAIRAGISMNNGVESLDNFEPPAGWTVIRNDMEFSYLKIENTTFQNQRQITELSVISNCSGQIAYGMKCHGSFIADLKKHFGIGTILNHLQIQEEVALFIEFLSCSSLCSGISVAEGEEMSAMVPHVIGNYEDLCTKEEKLIAYAAECKLIAPPGFYCSACSHLKKIDKNRKKRKEARIEMKPQTNKRYLSKYDVLWQLRKEQKAKRNAEKRVQYWKQKFDDQCIEMDKEDHDDLAYIIRTVKKEDVPENMECLLEQQKQILQTTSNNGYRWHPK